jgi:hypothetical protein
MLLYNPKDTLISLHIPKSGGTSFDRVLKQWFGFGFYRHYYNHAKLKAPTKASSGLFLKGLIPLCIHGHFDPGVDKVGVMEYYPQAKQFITLYRDPLELQLSFYFYQRKLIKDGSLFWNGVKVTDDSYLGKDVDEHLEEKSEYNWLRRFVPWELSLDNYKDIIENNFIHIGITENLQQSIDIFAEKLNKKTIHVPMENATLRKEIPSESSVKKFREKHQLEYAFYEYACNLNKK